MAGAKAFTAQRAKNPNMKTATTRLLPAGQLMLLGTLLTAPLFAQNEPEPTPFLDAIAPRSTHFAYDFGVKDVRGQLRLAGKAGLDASYEGLKYSIVGTAALDAHVFGAMREALALEVKHETELCPGNPTRSRSNAVGSIDEFEARATEGGGSRSRSNAVASRDDSDARAKQEFDAAVKQSVPGLEKTLRLCGFTVRLNAPPTESEKKDGKMAPKDLLPGGFKQTFVVGPVPVLIALNAGVGIDLGIDPFLEVAGDGADRHTCFGLEGGIGASLNGFVIGGVGGGCRFASAVAGVKGELKLMDCGTGLRLGYDSLHGAVVGGFYKLQPAVLKVLAIAYCEVGFGRFKIGKKFEYLIHEWKATERKGSLMAASDGTTTVQVQ